MAAPQIPNLLERLRASSQSHDARGRRSKPFLGSDDDVIQRTDQDAAGSRLSAVEQGYLEDPFARAFMESQDIIRRMPIINRGTYVRTRAIDALIQGFLDFTNDSSIRQIVSLGAGSDTRFFRLLKTNPELISSLRYHEIDFPDSTAKKVRAIERAPFVLSLLTDLESKSSHSLDTGLQIAPDKGQLSSSNYYLHGLDVRAFSDPKHKITLPGLLPTAPTLILSECCLTYIPEATNSDILQGFASVLIPQPAHLCIVLYEPLEPGDAFGKTMTANLATRGIDMPSLHAIPNLDVHTQRLVNRGFNGGYRGATVKEIWDEWVKVEEKERLKGLEMIDEEEEWMLLSAHYGLIWAERGCSTGFTRKSYTIT